jgi:tetratricopeptide (TPR) repeat protein
LNLNLLCKRSFPALFLVLLAGILVYVNTFHVPFVLDDNTSIVRNPVIKNLENFYANSSGYEFLPNRYLAFLTFALNYHFGGLSVTGYHVVNLLIHLVTALLVFALLRLTFRTPYFLGEERDSRPKAQGSRHSAFLAPSFFIPLFAVLLFVIHPVQTQAVTYIVQRLTSLATMFYLLSVVLYVQARLSFELQGSSFKGREESDNRQKANDKRQEAGGSGQEAGVARNRTAPVLLLAGSVLSAVLAMKTKEISFTLPLAIVLYEGCFFRGPWKRRLLFLLPILATLPIVPLTIIHSAGGAGQFISDSGEQLRVGTGVSRLDYLFTQFRVLVTYLRLLALPINQNLDYDYPVYHTFFTPPVFLSCLLLTALFFLGVYLFFASRHTPQAQHKPVNPAVRLIAFGIFWFFLTLSVESSIIPILDVIVEHRLYLPSIGAAAAFATVFCLLARKFASPASRKLAVLIAASLVLGLGFATHQRNHVWGNAIRLWQDVVAKSPKKARPYNNLGVALEGAGRRSEAFKTISRAIAVDPGYYKSYYNLADLYLVSDQPDAALPLLHTAIRIYPDFTEAYVETGAALMRGGQFHKVISFLEQNLDRVKEDGEAHFYLGSAYAFLGNREAAMRELAIVSRFDPTLAANLAGLLRMKSRHGYPNDGH